MKVRRGFISNSSSSSFIVFVDKDLRLDFYNFLNWLDKNNLEDHEVWIIQEGGCDGDYFRSLLTEKVLEILRKHPTSCDHLTFLIDPIWKDEDDFGDVIQPNMIGKIFDFMLIDHHGPRSSYDWLHDLGEISDEEYFGKKLWKERD